MSWSYLEFLTSSVRNPVSPPMYKDNLIKRLVSLPHPIIENVIFVDDYVEFCVLTGQEGFECLVGGAFPILGPITLSSTDKSDFLKVLSDNSFDDLENDMESVIQNSIHDKQRRSDLITLLYILQAGGLETYLSRNPAANKPFYVFNDMGLCNSEIFSSYRSVCHHFFNYFAVDGQGTPWSSMSDDELTRWNEMIKVWRKNGARKLIPKKYLGVYYSAFSGGGRYSIPTRTQPPPDFFLA